MKKNESSRLEDVKIRARGKWVLVKPIPKKEKFDKNTRLARPDSDEDEQKAVGTVINHGPDVSGLDAGDRVLYGVFAGERVEVFEKGKEVQYVLLLEEDIVAFIE